jgi:hypothetical protein
MGTENRYKVKIERCDMQDFRPDGDLEATYISMIASADDRGCLESARTPYAKCIGEQSQDTDGLHKHVPCNNDIDRPGAAEEIFLCNSTEP